MRILGKNLPNISNIQVDLGDLSFAPTSVKTKQCGGVNSKRTNITSWGRSS